MYTCASSELDSRTLGIQFPYGFVYGFGYRLRL